jgi:hypothetical protein
MTSGKVLLWTGAAVDDLRCAPPARSQKYLLMAIVLKAAISAF